MRRIRPLVIALTAAGTLGLAGCENLPGDRQEQTTGIGATAGAAIGATVADNDLIGALLGGAAGAAGGHLVGARTDWFERDEDYRRDQASDAVESAREDPVTPREVHQANSADINDDGFVTRDELLAMEEAGLSDSEILDRLEDTGQVFDLSEQQREDFIAAGLSRNVVQQMEDINRDQRERVLNSEVIGSSPS